MRLSWDKSPVFVDRNQPISCKLSNHFSWRSELFLPPDDSFHESFFSPAAGIFSSLVARQVVELLHTHPVVCVYISLSTHAPKIISIFKHPGFYYRNSDLITVTVCFCGFSCIFPPRLWAGSGLTSGNHREPPSTETPWEPVWSHPLGGWGGVSSASVSAQWQSPAEGTKSFYLLSICGASHIWISQILTITLMKPDEEECFCLHKTTNNWSVNDWTCRELKLSELQRTQWKGFGL